MPNKPRTLGEWHQATLLPTSEKRGFLCHFLGLTQIQTLTRKDLVLSENEIHELSEAVRRRLDGEPFPYIVGTQEFFSRPFFVNPSVLIPRPDTECLIEWLIDHIPKNAKAADLGTGSGCIAITLKLERPDLEVIATDISGDALAIAKKNAENLGAEIKFYQGDWLKAIPADESFDVIVSNPPYIDQHDEHLKQLTFEPISALTDHGNGLSYIEAIYSQASALQEKPSVIAIEHGWDQGSAVRQLAEKNSFKGAQTLRDYGGNDRFTVWTE